MIVGYTLGKGLIYSTWEYAFIKLPYEIAQGVIGAVLSMLLCWNFKIGNLFIRMIGTGN